MMVKTEEIIQNVKNEGRTWLTEIEAKQVLANAGIDVVPTELAGTSAEAVSISDRIGYPVAMKIVSPDITHKSDVGGVKLDLQNQQEVASAYDEITGMVTRKFPKAVVQGVAVQKMARAGVELIIGMNNDAQFGPVLMFGIGGIFTEIMKDVSFRIVPLDRQDAYDMIHGIKGFPLLDGYRGQEAVDTDNLENMLLKISDFMESQPDIKEMDINPVIAYKDGAVAVDARIKLGDAAS